MGSDRQSRCMSMVTALHSASAELNGGSPVTTLTPFKDPPMSVSGSPRCRGGPIVRSRLGGGLVVRKEQALDRLLEHRGDQDTADDADRHALPGIHQLRRGKQ